MLGAAAVSQIGIQPTNRSVRDRMKSTASFLCACVLCLGIGSAVQDTTTTTTTSHTSAKQDIKNAGHDTKNAAKDVGHATKKTTKKVVHKGAAKTEEGAEKVKVKTAPQ